MDKDDIMLLISLAWKESFAIVENNKQACANHGWFPLNFALMEHDNLKEGYCTEGECDVSHAAMLAFNDGQAIIDPAILNTRDGFF
jgi:hypothetical protein